MCKPYSIDLRERVLAYLSRHNDKKLASQLFRVGIATIYRWVKQQNEKGHLEPIRREYVYRKLDYSLLEQYMTDYPDHLLCEIARHFAVKEQTIFYALKRLKITRKKRRFSIKNEMKKEEKHLLMS
jgi:transposase